VPLQPPLAVQAVASVELQVRVVPAPLVTVVGLAVNVTVGTGATGVDAMVTDVPTGALVPPGPVHVSVNAVSAVSAAED
jgi:hypothetical protein